VEDSTALVIDGRTLEMMISRNSEIAFRLIKKLAQRLDAADELIQILLNPDPEARVMLGLKRLAESIVTASEGAVGDEVELRLTPEDLAHEVGAQLVHVHDVLRRLGRLHIAGESVDGTVIVADVGRLLEFLEFLDVPRKSEGR
jgi:CRP-like cAMP-binding protein